MQGTWQRIVYCTTHTLRWAVMDCADSLILSGHILMQQQLLDSKRRRNKMVNHGCMVREIPHNRCVDGWIGWWYVTNHWLRSWHVGVGGIVSEIGPLLGDRPCWLRCRSSQISYGYIRSIRIKMQGVGFVALPIRVQPSLSSYSCIAAACRMPMFPKILLMQRIILSVLHAAINSASVLDPAK